MPADFSQIGPYLFAALVVLIVYRRLRRSFGRQPLRPRRMTLRMIFLALLACTFAPLALHSIQYLGAEVTGAALGVALGMWGAERTRFQLYQDKLHYVPHTYAGIAVTLLVLGRLAYRGIQAYTGPHLGQVASMDPSHAYAPSSMVRSPLTAGIFFVLAGYYLCYYGLVLWKSKHLKTEEIEVASAAA
jgi:hypothetical protein